ncbi:MAG: glycosyltransferase family 39 protein [Lentisphaeria bacterium]|nr:glycosyltransferase family 39 protein [Lentisphaeria bacterium]NQZ70502.1 glycosyltransferase family 39 protein [Lentisphaeria bacterium]
MKIPTAGLLFLALFFSYMFTASHVGITGGDSVVMLGDSQRLAAEGLKNPKGFHKYGIGQILIDLPVAFILNQSPNITKILQRKDLTTKEKRAKLKRALFVKLLISSLCSFLPAALAALTSVLVYLVVAEFCTKKTAVITALLYSFSSMAWVYAQSLFSDDTVGLFLLAAVWGILRCKRADPDKQMHWAAFIGFVLAYSVLLKLSSLFAAAFLSIYFLWTLCRTDKKLIIAFFIPAIILGGVFCWWNHFRYGSILDTGYDAIGDRDHDLGFKTTPFYTGFFGLLISPGKGIFIYNPLLFLLLFKLKDFYAKQKDLAIMSLGVFVIFLLFHSCWWAWHGDWAWGPRFMMSAIPLLFAGLGFIIESIGQKVKQHGKKAVLILPCLLLVCGIFVQITGVLVSYSNYSKIVLGYGNIFPSAYNKNTWPLRDDTVHGHFIPEFSPIVGHWWMLKCILIKEDYKKFGKMVHHPPWRQLNPQWIPEYPTNQTKLDITFSWNIWWLFYRQHRNQFIGNANVVYVLAIFMFLAAGFSFYRLKQSLE